MAARPKIKHQILEDASGGGPHLCTKATANQLRLFLHAGAYWLMWGLRVSMPKRSMWRVAQFDTLRLRLIKIAARRRDEDDDQGSLADRRVPPRILRLAPGRYPALGHLNNGR